MFSQLNNLEVEDYFLRLNAQLKRMPQADRAELHRELRQHLEELAAAHEELGATRDEAVCAALSQFGDPRKFGKRMFREWQRTQPPCVNPLLLTFLCASGLLSADWWWFLFHNHDGTANTLFRYAVPVLAGLTTGLLLPKRALHGMMLAVPFVVAVIGLAIGFYDHLFWTNLLVGDLNWLVWLTGPWLVLGTVSAWAASRLRMGRTLAPERH